MGEQVAVAIAAVAVAEDRSQLLKALREAVRTLGFDSYNLSYNKTDVREFMTAPTLSTWSQAELDSYHRGDWPNRDPLLARAAQPGIREVWTPADWAVSRHTWEYADYVAGLGIRGGATVSITGRVGTVGAITALSMTSPLSRKVASQLYAISQAAALKATTLGIECLDIPAVASGMRNLTGRQREILDWAKKGKSNRDIAVIIGCSKRAVDYHMSEILRKLDVSSRAQAVILHAGER